MERDDLWEALMRGQALLAGSISDRLEDEVGIPLPWYEVLARLADAPDGRLRMQELAESMLVSKSGLTRLCDRIEEAGYLERASCPTDRRGTFAVLTNLGKNKVRAAAAVFDRTADQLFVQQLNSRERQALRSAMRKVIAATSSPRP